MKWRIVVPVCVSPSCARGGGLCGGWDPPPLRASKPPPPHVCTCRAQMSATEAHGLKSESYLRSQSGKGFLITKGFLKWGSR